MPLEPFTIEINMRNTLMSVSIGFIRVVRRVSQAAK